MDAAGSKTPQGDLVKVQLTLAQEGGGPQKEVVKRRSKRHEYVEVDGFHFRRKRRAPPTPVTAAAAAAVAADGTADAPLGYRSPAAGAHGTLQLDACAGGGAKASPLKAAAPAAVQDADAGMADDQQHEGEQQPAGAPAAPGDTAEEVPALPTAAGEAYDSEAADLMDAADDPDVAAATAAAATAAAAAEAAATTAAAAAQEVAALAAAEAAAASAAAAAAGEEATAGAVAAGEPVSFSMLPSELCQLVRTFLSGELQRLPSLTAEAAAQAADAAGAQLAAQLQRQCPPGGEDAAATGADQLAAAAKPRLTVLPYQVVQLKAKLQDKHAKLLQEQAAWVQLLQQYDALLAGGGTGQQQEQEQQQDPAEPAADAMQVDSAQQEEQEETMEGQEAAAAGKPDADAVAPAAAASPGPVSAEQEGVLRGVTLKVEMLTALVAKMEHLVSRAEATARSLQAGYRAEKFAMFPHIDSPAALIKSLTAASASQQQHKGASRH